MKKLFFSLTVAVALFQLSSCAKKEGCTSPSATNYNSEAEDDDGSCVYEASMILWMTEQTSLDLNADGITSLTYYLDDQVVGTSGTNVYFNGAPSCGTNGAVTITKNLGSSISRTYAGKVKDDSGNEIWTGQVTLSALTPCFQVQFTYTP